MNLNSPTPSQLIAAANGQVHSSDGWVVSSLNTDTLEYVRGNASCLVNIGHASERMVRPIYASESRSELFPTLCEDLRLALPYLRGQFVVV